MQPESPGGRRWPLHPELRTNSCESALPDPLEPDSRPKPLTVCCRGIAPRPVLDEKCVKPQCQKMVRMGDLLRATSANPIVVIPDGPKECRDSGFGSARRPGMTRPRHCEPTG